MTRAHVKTRRREHGQHDPLLKFRQAHTEWSDPMEDTLETVEDWSDGHGHMLPDVDAPPQTVIYADGCTVVPGENGSWTYTPASETFA